MELSSSNSISKSNSLSKGDQLVQQFYAKTGQIIVQSRTHPTNSSKSNRWFNIETNDLESVRQDLGPIKSLLTLNNPSPPPLLLYVFLDLSSLTHSLLFQNERIHLDASRLLLETWQLTISSRNFQGLELPTVYKKSILFFRTLFNLTRQLPTYKLVRRILKGSQSVEGLRISYRISSSRDLFPDEAHFDTELNGSRPECNEVALNHIETPLGVLNLHVLYRSNTEFTVEKFHPYYDLNHRHDFGISLPRNLTLSSRQSIENDPYLGNLKRHNSDTFTSPNVIQTVGLSQNSRQSPSTVSPSPSFERAKFSFDSPPRPPLLFSSSTSFSHPILSGLSASSSPSHSQPSSHRPWERSPSVQKDLHAFLQETIEQSQKSLTCSIAPAAESSHRQNLDRFRVVANELSQLTETILERSIQPDTMTLPLPLQGGEHDIPESSPKENAKDNKVKERIKPPIPFECLSFPKKPIVMTESSSLLPSSGLPFPTLTRKQSDVSMSLVYPLSETQVPTQTWPVDQHVRSRSVGGPLPFPKKKTEEEDEDLLFTMSELDL